MSRILYAPLKAAALCLALLVFVSPVQAFQFPAFHGDDDEAAPANSSPFDPERMAALDLGDDPVDPDAAAAADQIQARLMQSQLSDLQQQFAAMQEKLSKKQIPYIEVHAVSQMDTGFFGQNHTNIKEFGVLDNGSDFRRSRLAANGSITENMNYFFQMDFSFPGRPTFTDVWMEVTKLPILGNIRAGQWKQPFSLEVVSSFRYTTFPERSVLFQSFAPFRHIGIGFYDWSKDEMTTWAFSAYRAGQDQFGDALSYGNNGNYAIVGRTTHLMWYECEGSEYLHLGIGYNYVAPQGFNGQGANQPLGAPAASFGTVPEYFIGQNQVVTTGTAGLAQPATAIDGTPRFVNTGNFQINHYNLLGLEGLWVQGPLSVQTEGNFLMATRPNGTAANFAGFYTTFGYFLTGEHRPYIRKSGAIDRIKVLHNFIKSESTDEWGLGGWEAAVRFSYIDLNSNDIHGGRLFDTTVGLNWYLNSYAKVQFNYIRADLDRAAFTDSRADIWGIRGQFDF
jgi:phosphate-selective porin OprO/OprP